MNEQDVNVEFQTLSDDVFNQLMGDAPPTTQPSADALPGTPAKQDKPDPKPAKTAQPKKEEPVEDAPEKTQEEIDKDIDEAGEEGTQTSDNNEGGDNTDLSEFFKAKALGLIERGVWQDFDGIDEFEWTEENYGELAEKQAQWKAEDLYEERVSKVGDVGKAILEYAENGGNPADIIDLFKASRKIEEFDITTPDGKEETITEYYTKVVGWSAAKTKKYVKSLVDSGDDSLTQEATEAKDLMEQGIKEQIQDVQKQQKAAQERQKAQAEAWEKNMTKTIGERKDLTDKEKRDIAGALLVNNQKLPDGRVVNQFYLEFMKMQADPQRYIDLVRFVTNPDKFMEKVEKKVEAAVAKKNWNLIKGNGSLSKSTGTSHNKPQDKSKSDLVIDYRKLI